jgi:gamma-glutamyltranspeptidase/glutathione hydrolase
MRRLIPVLFVTLSLATLAGVPGAVADPGAPPKTPTAVGAGGAAASVDPVGTQAAIDTLRRGGNAVDAAVAAAGALGVVEPYSCGLGGGGYMVVYRAGDHSIHTIDSRETAPAKMDANAFTGLTTFANQRVSGMSVGVPGTLRAWQHALDQYGTWSLRRALQPGIRAAERGWTRRSTTRPTRPRRSSPTSRPPPRCTSTPTARPVPSARSSATPTWPARTG